ncbi:ATP-binding protein [Saccharibacillus sacchari]|uniref:ATP-binding protein n=1 Tax=Saccharibacillus sacchari TaxID=456493 RepID=UPI0004ACC42B|nr:ATP-binding protein [Saccharibacillus sacchari]
MELLKVFIIQVLFASLPVLLVPSFESFVRTRANRLLVRHGGDSVGIAFTCASSVSLLMCWFLDAGSTRIDGHLALLPTGMGILYGVPKGVFPLVGLYALVGSFFAESRELPYVWIEAAALLLLALSRSRMLGMQTWRRRVVLTCWLLVAYFPHAVFHMQESVAEGNGWAAVSRVAIELLGGLAAGLLLLYSRRDAQDRNLLNEQAGAMRERVIEEETKLQAFMRTLPGFALTLDRMGRVTGVNDRAFGAISSRVPTATREMVAGKSFAELMSSIGMQADPLFLKALDVSIRENRTAEQTMEFGGRKFSIYFSPAHTDQGEVFGAVCSIYDVTEVERMRAELEDMNRLSLIGQMAAGVTHEVRNPMAVVRGYLQILQKKTPDEYDHYYKIVLEELDRAGGIIDDFLALARTKQQMNESRTLRSVVEDLWPLLQADANLRGQTIRFEDGADGEEISMHPGEIKQLVLNLARNGLEAMDDKGELVIAIEELEDRLRLRVKDNGPGISEETLERIKQPFFTTKKTGTGLGLVLCSGIAERHGGSLSIESTVGEGTEVRIDFAKKNESKASKAAVEV